MKCLVLGKVHMEGKSKTGKSYNFHKVFVAYDDPGVIGQSCRDVFLDAATFDFGDIEIGGVYDAQVNFEGRLTGFELLDLPVSVG